MVAKRAHSAIEIRDSGHREVYGSGAQRDNGENKGAYELVSPLFMRRLALRLEGGAKRYSARNWELGMPLSRYVQALLRHTYQLLEGRTDEDHAAAVAFNIMAFMHTQEMIERGLLPRELDDMPNYTAAGCSPLAAGQKGEQRGN